MNISNLDAIINAEMRKAVHSVLESKLNKDSDEERRRQDRQAAAVKGRDLTAESEDGKSSSDEADDPKEDKKDQGDKKREDRTGGKGSPDSKKLKTPKKAVLRTPTIGSVIDKLNALRGGRSLKDPEVKNSFSQYFEGLSNSERQTLLAFLTGIAQILVGTKKGADALEPEDLGVALRKTKEVQADKEPTRSRSKEGTEENPIVVGENLNHDVARALRAYRKSRL